MSSTDIEARIAAHAIELEALFGLTTRSRDPLPPRQILSIQDMIFFSAGFVASTGAAPSGQSYILLTGTPTPNSEVTRGYLRFVPRAEIRQPRYDAQTKTMNVWLDQATQAMTLAQLQHSQRHLWIGWFAQGHVYADLHSIP